MLSAKDDCFIPDHDIILWIGFGIAALLAISIGFGIAVRKKEELRSS